MNTNKTVVIKLKGGMGNQMFQYAFGKALEESAERAGNPIDLLFDTTAYTNPGKKDTLRPYLLPVLNTHARVASDKIALQTRNPYGIISKILRRVSAKLKPENSGYFDPSLLQPPYKNYYEGYWQSEKYFLPIAERIRREFTLRHPLGRPAQVMYERIVSDPNAVSIFYRRADYVGHKMFDIGEQEYQQRAITRMHELIPGCRFYVMSDDIEWVKENAELPADSVFVSSKEIPPQEEQRLAAVCKHHIIPNSTFAWWGAWLDQSPDKIVIAPRDWVRGNSDEFRDIIPEDWLRV